MSLPTAYFPTTALPSPQEHAKDLEDDVSFSQIANATLTGAYAASGAITITITGAFANWHDYGLIRNISSSEVLRYTSKTDDALTIPAAGRARAGTSAAAGSIGQEIQYIEARATGTVLDQVLSEVNAFQARLRDGPVLPCRNETGGTLVKGTLVYISGYSAGQGLPLISKADADAVGTLASHVLAADLADNANGVVYAWILVTGLDTSGAGAAGDPVYQSGTAGEFTFSAPSLAQEVGRVLVKDATVGELQFAILPATISSGLQDVVDDTTPQLGGDLDGQANEIKNVAKLLLGASSFDSAYSHMEIIKDTYNVLRQIACTDTATDGPEFYHQRTRGSYASKTVPQSGDQLGLWHLCGYTGSAWGVSASLGAEAAATHAAGSTPGAAYISTTPTGAVASQKRLYVDKDGKIGIGKTAALTEILDVVGNIAVSGTVDGRDLATDGTKLDGVAAGANNYSHPNHSGDVTSTGDGATVIGANKVDGGAGGGMLNGSVINDQTVTATIDDADELLIDDGAGGTLRKITRDNLFHRPCAIATDAVNDDDGGAALDNAEWEILRWTTESFDNDTMFDAADDAEIIVPEAGRYLICICIAIAANATGVRYIDIYKNDVSADWLFADDTSTGSAVYRVVTAVLDLAANDEIEVRVFQNSGGALNLVSSNCHFTVTRIE